MAKSTGDTARADTGRTDSGRRSELLRECRLYLARHGLADVSLSPMAAELGTSKRMLLYYFGNRSNLIHEAIATSRPDVDEMFRDVADFPALHAAGRRLWEAITTGEQQRLIPMLFQLLSVATTRPEQYGELAVDAVRAILDPIAEAHRRLGLTDEQAGARASLLVSALRGLCQDRLVTGETDRVDAAARMVIDDATAPPDQ